MLRNFDWYFFWYCYSVKRPDTFHIMKRNWCHFFYNSIQSRYSGIYTTVCFPAVVLNNKFVTSLNPVLRRTILLTLEYHCFKKYPKRFLFYRFSIFEAKQSIVSVWRTAAFIKPLGLQSHDSSWVAVLR